MATFGAAGNKMDGQKMVIKRVKKKENEMSPIASMQMSSDSPGNKNKRYLPPPPIDTPNNNN
jgi:hypothetical protein